MEVLDTTVVNVSLPHIAGSLSATNDEATWTLTSYLVANAIILPMTGWLAGRFGRKRLLMMSVSGFTVASFLCGLAPSLPFLILCRVIQGACGGGLQPLSQAILLESFPPEKRGQAMAFWALGIVVAPMLGPVAGGWLTDNYSWRWVFYINIPIGIIALILTEVFIFDPHYLRRQKTGIDYWGIGLLTVGIGSLQIMLDKGQEDDWFGSHFIVTLARARRRRPHRAHPSRTHHRASDPRSHRLQIHLVCHRHFPDDLHRLRALWQHRAAAAADAGDPRLHRDARRRHQSAARAGVVPHHADRGPDDCEIRQSQTARHRAGRLGVRHVGALALQPRRCLAQFLVAAAWCRAPRWALSLCR